jgi:hypothetical protein
MNSIAVRSGVDATRKGTEQVNLVFILLEPVLAYAYRDICMSFDVTLSGRTIASASTRSGHEVWEEADVSFLRLRVGTTNAD